MIGFVCGDGDQLIVLLPAEGPPPLSAQLVPLAPPIFEPDSDFLPEAPTCFP